MKRKIDNYSSADVEYIDALVNCNECYGQGHKSGSTYQCDKCDGYGYEKVLVAPELIAAKIFNLEADGIDIGSKFIDSKMMDIMRLMIANHLDQLMEAIDDRKSEKVVEE